MRLEVVGSGLGPAGGLGWGGIFGPKGGEGG